MERGDLKCVDETALLSVLAFGLLAPLSSCGPHSMIVCPHQADPHPVFSNLAQHFRSSYIDECVCDFPFAEGNSAGFDVLEDLHRLPREHEHFQHPEGTVSVASVHVRQQSTGGDSLVRHA